VTSAFLLSEQTPVFDRVAAVLPADGGTLYQDGDVRVAQFSDDSGRLSTA
jgi:hypothetical protein